MVPKVEKFVIKEPFTVDIISEYVCGTNISYDLSMCRIDPKRYTVWELKLPAEDVSFLALKHPELKIEKVSS